MLAYLHNQQPPIIYRDLKPANVMIEGSGNEDWGEGTTARQASIANPPVPNVVLIDFGIARFYRPGGDLRHIGLWHSLAYAPPEQYGKGQTDARTDIYALGVLLHHALTGHDPAATPFALPAPGALNPALPAAVAAAIERATANDRDQRFPDIAAFRAALYAPAPPMLLHQPGVPGPQARLGRPAQANVQAPARSRTVIWGIALVAVLLIGGLLTFALARSRERDLGGLAVAATAELAVLNPTAALRSTNTPEATNMPEVEGSSAGQARPPSGATAAEIVTIRPKRVSASGSAPSNVDSQGNTVTYDPPNATDGKNDTAWRVERDGVEQWLQLDFDAEVAVRKIGIIPGYDKVDQFDGTDRFTQNRVLKRVRLEFSDGSNQRASFAQQRDMQFVVLPKAVRTRFVRIVILDTFPPPPAPAGRDFTPISEVVVQAQP